MQIAVIGAGFTGLTAAYELALHGHDVTVYEARPVAGGLSSGFEVDRWEWTLDRFYRHVFAGDEAIIGLSRKLRVPLTFSQPKTSVWVNGSPYVYDNPIGVARYPNLPLTTNLRIGLVVAYLKYLVRDGTRLEGVTAHEWMRRAMGRRGYTEIWEPMLRGKFKADHAKVNMAWFWARLAARTPRLGYIDGGFQVLIEALADAVRQMGGQVHLDTPIRQIDRAQERIALTLSSGTCLTYDRVLTTTSPRILGETVVNLPAAYLDKLASFRSTGAVVLILALRHSVLTDGTYWLNLPQGQGPDAFPCLSMVEHTNYQAKAHYGGDVIVYLGDYVETDAPQMRASAQELYALYRPALLKVRPDYQDSWVRDMWSYRASYAQPVPEVHHSERVPSAQEPVLPNLYWASMHHIYPWDRGTNYAVELGQRVAATIHASTPTAAAKEARP
jgi:protoporphyrinogen oxidase